MNKDKQIEEMACLLGVDACRRTSCKDCAIPHNCIWLKGANKLYNADYRKASEVVVEVLADVMFNISKIVSKHIGGDNSLTEAEVDIIHALVEIKKKYTEGNNG